MTKMEAAQRRKHIVVRCAAVGPFALVALFYLIIQEKTEYPLIGSMVHINIGIQRAVLYCTAVIPTLLIALGTAALHSPSQDVTPISVGASLHRAVCDTPLTHYSLAWRSSIRNRKQCQRSPIVNACWLKCALQVRLAWRCGVVHPLLSLLALALSAVQTHHTVPNAMPFTHYQVGFFLWMHASGLWCSSTPADLGWRCQTMLEVGEVLTAGTVGPEFAFVAQCVLWQRVHSGACQEAHYWAQSGGGLPVLTYNALTIARCRGAQIPYAVTPPSTCAERYNIRTICAEPAYLFEADNSCSPSCGLAVTAHVPASSPSIDHSICCSSMTICVS